VNESFEIRIIMYTSVFLEFHMSSGYRLFLELYSVHEDATFTFASAHRNWRMNQRKNQNTEYINWHFIVAFFLLLND
jgi:hypothetical protein